MAMTLTTKYLFTGDPNEVPYGWDKVLKLKVIDDKAPLSSTGLVDRRLFTGQDNLHAVKDHETGLWNIKYTSGQLPDGLKGRFTNLTMLLRTAGDYFKKRNLEIVEVRDAQDAA